MNDTELDELLDRWGAPKPPASLRENLRAGFAARPKERAFSLWRISALSSAAAGLFLLAMTQAFPQTLRVSSPEAKIPYTTQSEAFRYADDGSVAGHMLLTSYSDKGREIILEKTSVGHPFETLSWAVSDLHDRTMMPLFMNADQIALEKAQARVSAGFEQWHLGNAATMVSSGCVQGGEVIGRASIFNFPTVGIRRDSDRRRITVWMAPDLACFALRAAVEVQRPDGVFRLAVEKHALKVTSNAKR